MLSGRSLPLIPPFPGPAALLQVLVPVLPVGGRPGGYGVALLGVLLPELLCGLLSRPVRVQAQDDLFQMRVLPQVGVQRPLVQSAQGYGVAGNRPVQGAEAHEVDGGLEHRNPIQGGVTGEPEGHALVAAGGIPLEAGAAQVVGAALAGEYRLSSAVPAHEHAVVVQAVLVQQAGLDEASDHLGGDASLLKIGKHPPLVLVGDGQGKGRLFLLRGWSRAWDGGVPGAVSIELQQVGHGIPESLPAELLQESDGVPAGAVGVALPGPAVFDAKTVHLPGGVVAAAQPPDAVAQVFQQVRQVCPFGSLHLLVREAEGWGCALSRSDHLLWRNEKNPPEHPTLGMLWGFSSAVDCCGVLAGGLTRPFPRPTGRGSVPPGAGGRRRPAGPHRG